MSDMNSCTFYICYGVPGSGKRSWAYKFKKEHKGAEVIERDRNYFGAEDHRDLNSMVSSSMSDYCRHHFIPNNAEFVFNFPICTNEDLEIVLGNLALYMMKSPNFFYHIVIENFEDKNNIAATQIIGKTRGYSKEYEELDITNFDVDSYDIVVNNHIVEKKSDIVKKIGEIYPDIETGVIESYSWISGGMLGSFMGDVTPVESEQPFAFTELYSILDLIAPNLLFKDYRDIEEEIYIRKKEVREYYGGFSEYSHWVCDVDTLISILQEKGYIK